MMDEADKRIEKLNRFLRMLDRWEETHDPELRAELNRTKASVQREVVEAGCSYTMTISPPPAVGGMIMRNIDPFDMIFQEVYLQSLNSHVRDMIQQTIGAIEEQRDNPQEIEERRNEPEVIYKIQRAAGSRLTLHTRPTAFYASRFFVLRVRGRGEHDRLS